MRWRELVSITPRLFWAVRLQSPDPARIAPRLLRKVSPLHREPARNVPCTPVAATTTLLHRELASITQRLSRVVLPLGREPAIIAPRLIGASASAVQTGFLEQEDRRQKLNQRQQRTLPGLTFREFQEILVRYGKNLGHRA